MNKLLELLKKLKRASDIYQHSGNERKIRLFDACSVLFNDLEVLGYPRIVSESLLMFGDDFYWSEHLKDAGYKEAGEVFDKTVS